MKKVTTFNYNPSDLIREVYDDVFYKKSWYTKR